ncbi:hypothetical protein LUX33_10140 [Actinomadura madurae]|uniref:hypothetical protein n=1 Tax=Actinomadura madurae TaxID=1993 RepID=UPI0020D22CD5|nr:hypothetical protein [Actinomadura madurae]MCP9948740.1 hypothetical protein [Actinomadura madurae]
MDEEPQGAQHGPERAPRDPLVEGVLHPLVGGPDRAREVAAVELGPRVVERRPHRDHGVVVVRRGQLVRPREHLGDAGVGLPRLPVHAERDQQAGLGAGGPGRPRRLDRLLGVRGHLPVAVPVEQRPGVGGERVGALDGRRVGGQHRDRLPRHRLRLLVLVDVAEVGGEVLADAGAEAHVGGVDHGQHAAQPVHRPPQLAGPARTPGRR